MSTMIEKVARALHDAWLSEPVTIKDMHANGPYPPWEEKSAENKARFYKSARAAIEAMREPTQSIMEAAEDIVVGYNDFALGDGNIYLGIPGYPHKATQVWEKLIDAALKETQP